MPPRRAPSSSATRTQPTRSSSRTVSSSSSAPAPTRTVSTRRGKAAAMSDEEEEEKPMKRTARGSRRSAVDVAEPVQPTRAKRTTRTTRRVVQSESDDESDDEEEDEEDQENQEAEESTPVNVKAEPAQPQSDDDDGDAEGEDDGEDDAQEDSEEDEEEDSDAEEDNAAAASDDDAEEDNTAATATATAVAASPSSSDTEADKENRSSSTQGSSKDDDGYATATEHAPAPAKSKSKSPLADLHPSNAVVDDDSDVSDDTSAAPADKSSSSFDADATFVAPSDSSPTATPAASGRFSLASAAAGPSSIPSTPKGKGTATVPNTPGPAQPSTRLVIHKLVLKDFKSYAGLQTIGPFHKSFSSVVGPNGSGKSNVIDSLLFVFGWRANKMRQGKLSELIHSSSQAGKARPTETKVSVVFREIIDLPGPDAYRVVPKSKLVVTRTAYQNNSSVYHLNGKKSSFTEVTTLLREKGIDLDHKRFLILQGEVESIAQMPPKARNEHEEGLLEYLEDIIGTSRFKEEIEQANKTVEECNEQRGERLGRLKIVQREKDALEPKKREAESLLRDHNSLTQQQSRLWQIYMWECRTAMEKAGSVVKTLKERLAAEEDKNKDAQANVAELEASYSSVKKEWDDLKKEADKLTKEVEQAEREDLQLGEKRKHLETKKKKIAKSMSEDKRHLTEAKNTQSSSEEDIERLRAELEKLESSLETEEAALETIRDSLKSKTGHLSEQVETKQRELAPWMDKLKEKENARDVRVQEVDLIKGREEARMQERLTAKQQRQELKEQLQVKQEELVSLANEKGEVGTQIEKSEAQLQKDKKHFADRKAEAVAARSTADDAKSAQQTTASRSSVLTALTRQAELGMIKGFHGRLGSLGVIDDRYDVAISTACPGLDSIVVDTVECAQACIEYLRKNNVGRGNFISLEKISNAPVERIQTPDNAPRLVDLVKSRDPRFMPAFYFQLKDTLVARDLPQANRIAYGAKRWRVVTLDGELIDKSGTMSGGGNRVARGAMSSKFAEAEHSPEKIAQFQQKAAQLEGEVQALGMQIQRKEVELRDMRERPNQIDIEIEKTKMALKVDNERLQDATKRLEELKAQSEPDAADTSRLEQLESEVKAFEKEIVKLHSQTSVYEKDIAALQEKILDAGGVGLRTQQSKVDGIREMMDLSSEKSTKAEVAKTKADKDIIKLENSLKKHEAGLAELDEELEGLQGSMSNQTGAVAKMRAKLEEKQSDMESKQEVRDDLKSRLDESSSTINAFRSLKVELNQKIEDNERALTDNEHKSRHWEEKHEKLELHHIDDDDDDDEDEDDEDDAEKGDNEGEDDADESKDGDAADTAADADNSQVDASATKARKGKTPRQQNATTLPTFEDEELSGMDKDAIKAEIVIYEERVQKGSGNFAILDEYRKREQEFLARAKDLEQTTQQRDAAKQRYDELRKQRLDEFMLGFGIISSKLKEMYQTITLGGNAELELVDSLDPFSEGILFSVMPPKKSWKNISNLSGGEKTLSSLALVFALHVFKPTPLYVMDEIDAALDFRNVSIVANLIKERTKNAQFVIISLRNNMFELASRLVGIYKTNGQTKSLAVENTELSQAMADEAAAASATVAASARKARMFPNPPKTPGTASVSRMAGGGIPASASAAGNLQRFSGAGGIPRSSSTLGSSGPSTPSRPGAMAPSASQRESLSQFSNVNGPASIFKRPQLPSSASHTGLPQTPLRIPQTPRMPKSILARTPRVPSATPRVPSGGSQVGTSQRRDS